jgi:predicted nucleic acid-binding protein
MTFGSGNDVLMDTAKLRALGAARLRLPLFALCELQAGAASARDPERDLARLERATQYMETVYPGVGFAALYGESASLFRRLGSPIPTMDLLVAILAKAEGEPVLTRDTEHYGRVPGVTVESY